MNAHCCGYMSRLFSHFSGNKDRPFQIGNVHMNVTCGIFISILHRQFQPNNKCQKLKEDLF